MYSDEVKEAVLSFVALMENGRPSEQQAIDDLETILDRLAWLQHSSYLTGVPRGESDPHKRPYAELRELAARSFPGFGYYNIPARITDQIAEAEVIVGDAIDDLADIAGELQKVAWAFENSEPEGALYRFRQQYEIHWRNHLRHLQWYIEALRFETE